MAGDVSLGGIPLRGGKEGTQVEAKEESANQYSGTDVQGRSVTSGGVEEGMGGCGGVA